MFMSVVLVVYMFIVVSLFHAFTSGSCLADGGSAARFKSETESCRRITTDTAGRNESINYK